MDALAMQNTDSARAIAERHEILAHDSDRQRQVIQLRRQTYRMPEPPEILSAGRLGPDAHEFIIRPWRNAPCPTTIAG